MNKHILAVCVLSAVLLSSCGSGADTSGGESIFVVSDSETESFAGKAEETSAAEIGTEKLSETVNTYYDEYYSEAAEMISGGMIDFIVWKGSAYRENSVRSETFFTEEGIPEAVLQLDEKLSSLGLGESNSLNESRFENARENYCIEPISGGAYVRYEFYSNGKNAELDVWDLESGITVYFDIDIDDYNEIAALAEELAAYKTPVSYDDTVIKDIVSEDYAEVTVNESMHYDRFTDETAGKLMELLRSCEYTPMPDDTEESYYSAEFRLYKNTGDTEPVMLRLCNSSRKHGEGCDDTVAVFSEGKEYFYSIAPDEWEEIYRLTDWGPNYVM